MSKKQAFFIVMASLCFFFALFGLILCFIKEPGFQPAIPLLIPGLIMNALLGGFFAFLAKDAG